VTLYGQGLNELTILYHVKYIAIIPLVQEKKNFFKYPRPKDAACQLSMQSGQIHEWSCAKDSPYHGRTDGQRLGSDH